jgi:hypothetical protein
MRQLLRTQLLTISKQLRKMNSPSSASSVLRITSLILALTWDAPTLAQAAGAQTVSAGVETMSIEQAREENAYAVGLQAYLWGFPLQYYSKSTPKSVSAGGSYLNDFRRFTELKTAKDKFVVTPTTLRSTPMQAWI